MTTNRDKLLALVKARNGGEQFGYGITTADRYVVNALTELDESGVGFAAKHLHMIGNARESTIKRAAQTLSYCGEETKTDRTETNLHAMAKLLGVAPPPHSMMAIVNRLTTPREDRDGDTLQTKGANLDPNAPLLWQHLHNVPLGKMVRVIEKNDTLLKVATVLLDLNELTSDAAKLVEAGVLRFSHGFIPLKFEERKGGPTARFNILEFDIVEESLVSVPSNVDAEIELFQRGKLASPVFKAHAKKLFDSRNKSMPVTAETKALMQKFNPDQPRDPNGQFASGGGTPSGGSTEGSGDWFDHDSGGDGAYKWSEHRNAAGDRKFSADTSGSFMSEDGVQSAFKASKRGSTISTKMVDDTTISGKVVQHTKLPSGKIVSMDVEVASSNREDVEVGDVFRLEAGEPYSEITVHAKSKRHTVIYRKMFDVATERLEPCTQEQDWAARYIGCSVKDMSSHETSASGMMIGAFLAGLDAVTAKYRIDDTRNMKQGGEEAPPVHEVIEIKSDERRTFLVEGIRFAKADDHRLVWRTWQGWGGQHLLVYTENDKFAHDLIDKVWEWVDHNNPLKGQAFALAGGWISKTGTCWEDVFLEPEIESALKRTVRIINERGADAANRGQVLSGPPGTGKTLSARVMLNEADCTFIWVSAKDFWKLGSYQAFAGAFQMARSLAPSIICFEDVDNWIDSYTVDLLKGEMDGLQQSTGVTTILTTNFPDQLPAALIDRPGRFHDVLEIHLPSKDVRLRMLQKWASDANLESLAKMADDTDGYSGAHVYELCHFAKVIRDEEECSLDDALTKAFAKVKDQRDLINQNQLAGSSYRPGRRELDAAMAKGWKGHENPWIIPAKYEAALEKAMQTKAPGDGGITGGIIGPVPNDGESQETFMGRCMIDPSMMDNYPTIADRQAACKVQFGKSAKPEEKKMGECKECGKKANLNDDGYCATCAKDGSKPGAPRMPAEGPKGGKPTVKSGRVLSQRNFDALQDVHDDLEECAKLDMPRSAKAMVRGCVVKIKSVLDAATPESDDTQIDKQPTVEDIFRNAVALVGENRQYRDQMQKLIETFNECDELEQVGDDFRILTSAG